MNYDTLIFDLDGTLWDCSALSTEAFNMVFAQFGISRRFDADFIRSISGKPSTECDQILLTGVPPEIRVEVSRCLDDAEVQIIRKFGESALLSGVREGLDLLSRHYTLGLVSNCGTRYLEAFTQRTSVGPLFAHTECFGRRHRPKNENIRAVVERSAGIRACYVGDTRSDQEAAAAAGVAFYHAAYGFGTVSMPARGFGSFSDLSRHFLDLHALRMREGTFG